MATEYVTCIMCSPPKRVVAALFAAHMRRHDGTDYASQRRPVKQPRAGAGSRSRRDTEGRGRQRRRWALAA